MADWGPHEDLSYGKKRINIEGYYKTFVPRVSPDGEFGNEDRKWRHQWLKDQVLKGADKYSPPTTTQENMRQLEQNPEWRKARYNIFRRIMRAPMDAAENVLIKTTGIHWLTARNIRLFYSSGWKWMAVVWLFSYHLMYQSNNWEEKRNWKIFYTKAQSVPGLSDWPAQEETQRAKADYFDQGFSKSAVTD